MRGIMTAVIFFIIVLTVGCSTTYPPKPTGWSAFPSRPISDLITKAAEVSPELKVARLKYIEKKQSEFLEIMTVIDKKLDDLRRTADKNSALTLWTGGAGIASGVAATTLAVASPANVVWVAGLSAFGTGVLTFQTRAALEGYSRDAVARVYNQTITKIQKSTSQIGADFEFLRQYVDLTGDVFDKRAGELDGRIVSLYSTAILTPLIVGADQDVEELKRRNAEILKKLEDAQKQIDELKKNTGGS